MDWIATFLSLVGIGFNARKNILCWYFWFAGSCLWTIIAVRDRDLPNAILWLAFSFANCYGLYLWENPKKGGSGG